MTIPWITNPGGAFTRLGAAGGILSKERDHHKDNGVAEAKMDTFTDQLTAVTESGGVFKEFELAEGCRNLYEFARGASMNYRGSIIEKMRAITKRFVLRDNPQVLGDENHPDALRLAVEEIYRQMVADAQTVRSHTIGSTVGSMTGTGNGTMILSTVRGDGRTLEAVWPEDITIKCTNDSYSTTPLAVRGKEWFYARGWPRYPGGVAHPEWGTGASPNKYGSGCNTRILSCDPTQFDPSAPGGNLMANGNLETWSNGGSAAPDRWAAFGSFVGGTHFQRTANPYTGTYALQFTGNAGAVGGGVYQGFNDPNQNNIQLKGLTQYGVCFAAKADVVPAAGAVIFELTDSSGTIINDQQGVANSFTITCNTQLTTSYALFAIAWRTPASFTTTPRLRIRKSVEISAGSNVWFDHIGMCAATRCYGGGPEVAIFSGSTAWVKDDRQLISPTNNYGTATHRLASFQTLLADILGTQDIDPPILFPVSATPSISNSLITV